MCVGGGGGGGLVCWLHVCATVEFCDGEEKTPALFLQRILYTEQIVPQMVSLI